MPLIVGGAVLGGSLLSGIFGSSAAKKAAKAQAAAAQAAIAEQRRQYDQTRGDLAPYRDIGVDSTTLIADIYGFNGPEAQARAQAQFRTDPGYQFQVDEGQRAVQNSAAARGSGLSGGTLDELQRRRMGYADQGYGNWYSRLAGQQSIGENAAAQTGNFGAQAANQISSAYGDYGAAKAGGYIGQANAITGSLSDMVKAYGYVAGNGGFGGSGGGGGWSGAGVGQTSGSGMPMTRYR